MKEVLKLALDALETCCAGDYSTGHVIDPSFDEDAVNEAITAIKEALAQDELCSSQEPVAWFIDVTTDGLSTQDYQVAAKEYWGNLSICFPLYTTPPKRPWVGLTDEEIENGMCMSIQKTCRAIEAKLKEKNT